MKTLQKSLLQTLREVSIMPSLHDSWSFLLKTRIARPRALILQQLFLRTPSASAEKMISFSSRSRPDHCSSLFSTFYWHLSLSSCHSYTRLEFRGCGRLSTLYSHHVLLDVSQLLSTLIPCCLFLVDSLQLSSRARLCSRRPIVHDFGNINFNFLASRITTSLRKFSGGRRRRRTGYTKPLARMLIVLSSSA